MEQSIILTTLAFCEGGSIPRRHTGFGDDLSPELLAAMEGHILQTGTLTGLYHWGGPEADWA